jgi:hypothetical protein
MPDVGVRVYGASQAPPFRSTAGHTACGGRDGAWEAGRGHDPRGPACSGIRHFVSVLTAGVIMIRSQGARERCIRSCVSDLRNNGIDLTAATERRVRQVVREHIDYFQLMLGYDSNPAEIIELVQARGRTAPR